jgi:hypothetical protein
VSRSIIAKLFYGSLAAIILATVLIAVAIGLVVASSSLIMDGPDVVGIRSPFGWGMFALAALASLVLLAASIAQLVAWIGALIDTAPLENKTWFVVLLVTGILGFGLVAMLVYLLTEPGVGRGARPTASAPAAVSAH